MPTLYRATLMKEIYWKGQTYRSGDKIKVVEEDMRILNGASIIGDIRKIQETEFAVKEPPENAMKPHRRKRSANKAKM